MEIIYDLQFEWNNYWSFQIVQSQQCSGQEHEAYVHMLKTLQILLLCTPGDLSCLVAVCMELGISI